MTGARILAASVALALASASLPAYAKPEPKVTPQSADAARAQVRAELGDTPGSSALREQADKLGDPELFVAAAKAALGEAQTVAEAEAAREPAAIALDILHYLKGRGPGRWQVVAPERIDTLIGDAESLLQDVATKIEEIEAAAAAGEGDVPAAKSPRKKARPGTGLLAGGTVAVVLGAGGLGVLGAGLSIGASRQREVEKVDPMDMDAIDRLDAEGKRANTLAYVGAAVGAVGLATGIALIVLGVKKRKGSRTEPTAMVLPTARGLVVSGRF